MCICTGYTDLFFSVSTIRTLAKVYNFVQLVWNRFSMNGSEAVQSDIFLTVNIPMLPNCDIINQLSASVCTDVQLWFFSPIANH